METSRAGWAALHLHLMMWARWAGLALESTALQCWCTAGPSYPGSNRGLAQCMICDLQHCCLCTETCYCAPPPGGSGALTLGILSGCAQPQSGQLKHGKTEHPAVRWLGWFDLQRSRDTSLGTGKCYCQIRVGDGVPGIWEEHKLCAHPTDLFMLLLCCIMSNLSVNHLENKKFISSPFFFFSSCIDISKRSRHVFLPALACV